MLQNFIVMIELFQCKFIIIEFVYFCRENKLDDVITLVKGRLEDVDMPVEEVFLSSIGFKYSLKTHEQPFSMNCS